MLQIETTIYQEQNRTIWVPSGTIWYQKDAKNISNIVPNIVPTVVSNYYNYQKQNQTLW